MVLEAVKRFLLEKEVAVIHLIAVAILSPLLIWLFNNLFTTIKSAINKVVGPVIKFIAKVNRYRKHKLTINEYINITERIERGGTLKWYEKKGYEASKQQEKEFKEALKNRGPLLIAPDIKGLSFKLNGRDDGHDNPDA